MRTKYKEYLKLTDEEVRNLPLTRQAIDYIFKYRRGECHSCKNPRVEGRTTCESCAVKRRARNVRWDLFDPNLPTKEMAYKLGVTEQTITLRRNKLGILPASKKRWENVDWVKPKQQIADELGVTRNAVCYQFKKWNKQISQ